MKFYISFSCAEKYMFSREKSLSGSLLTYSLVDFCTTCGSIYTPYLLVQEQVLFQGLLLETEIHSSAFFQLWGDTRYSVLSFLVFSSLCLMLRLFLLGMKCEWQQVVLGTVGTIHFMANAIPAYACGDEWQVDQELWPQVHGCIRCTHVWPVLTESHWQHLRPIVSLL